MVTQLLQGSYGHGSRGVGGEKSGEIYQLCGTSIHPLHIREAPHKDDACSNGILPNSVSTPPPQANGRFVAGIFRRKLANSLKQRF